MEEGPICLCNLSQPAACCYSYLSIPLKSQVCYFLPWVVSITTVGLEPQFHALYVSRLYRFDGEKTSLKTLYASFLTEFHSKLESIVDKPWRYQIRIRGNTSGHWSVRCKRSQIELVNLQKPSKHSNQTGSMQTAGANTL